MKKLLDLIIFPTWALTRNSPNKRIRRVGELAVYFPMLPWSWMMFLFFYPLYDDLERKEAVVHIQCCH